MTKEKKETPQLRQQSHGRQRRKVQKKSLSCMSDPQ